MKSTYSFSGRSARTATYKKQSFDDTFEQQKKREIHPSMNPKGVTLREARDSDTFPNSLPVIFGIDITGSMDYIPEHLIKDGLPTLISLLHEKGITDAAVMFMGLGDSRRDRAPFQIGQFESSDEPMDMWLTRTWVEGGGGGNGGESYSWAWYFAAKCCKTDAWEKRGQKGFIFTVGDDDCFGITSREFQEVMGVHGVDLTAEELYKEASKQWHVYHINLPRQHHANTMAKYMGENLIQLEDHTKIPETIAKIIASHSKITIPITTEEKTEETGKDDSKITL